MAESKKGKVLLIDDNEDLLFATKLLLTQNDYEVVTVNHPSKVPALLEHESFDVFFLDMNYSQGVTDGGVGLHWMKEILKIDPDAVIILITAYGDVEMAVKAMREGATDYILKPCENDKILATISMAIKLRNSYKEKKQLQLQQRMLSRDINQSFGEIIGQCESMQRVFSIIHRVAKTEANVLILGENGTGKELVARALHRNSSRKDRIFMNVDMGAISETLFESELFGHVRGAFTDARENRVGRMEAASGGSLFLDEIGNLSMPLQAKLLKVLADREVVPVGSNKPRAIDVRLICATNMPLYEMIDNNEFRLDLLFRVNTVEIKLPPLRERVEDIPVLLDHFVEVYCKKYKMPVKKVSTSLLDRLLNYHWPGNIRELQHLVERAVIMSESDVLDYRDFLFPNQDGHGEKNEVQLDDYNLENVEKMVIRKVMVKHGGNVTHAAEELGLTRASLYRRMKRYGL